MANKLQKKLFAALTHKKKRNQDGDEHNIGEWETALEQSAYATLVPSLTNLQVNAEQYQDATPEKLQQIFLNIIEVLKQDYFNQELNRKKLLEHLNIIYEQTHILDNEADINKIFLNYVNNNSAIVQLFINSQMPIAIQFSKLLISVISRQIKNSIGFATSQVDNESIIKQINDLVELCPEPKEATINWLHEELNKYQLQEIKNISKSNQAFDDLIEPLLDLASENLDLNEEDLQNELTDNLSNQEGNTFNFNALSYYKKTMPIEILLSMPISNHSVRRAYRKLYNLITKKLNLQEPHNNNKLHKFIIEVITSVISENSLEDELSIPQLIKYCKRERGQQKSIIELCQKITNQRKLIKSLIAKLDKISESTETKIAKEFLTKKIEARLYKKIKNRIKRITKNKLYISNKSFEVNLIKYFKSLLTQPVYESSALAKISFKEKIFTNYFSLKSLRQIKSNIIRLSKNTLHSSVKRECSYLLHTLTFNKELTEQLQKIQALYFADFNNVITYLIEPYENEQLLALTNAINDSTLSSTGLKENLNLSNLSAVKLELIKYQEHLRALSVLRLEAIQHPDDSSYNERIDEAYKQISASYSKLYFIIDLIAIIEMLPQELIAKELKPTVDNMISHFDDINSSFIYLSNIAHEFGYRTIDPKDIFFIRIVRGDFFHQADHDLLSNATIAMHTNISPLELLDGINESFQRYTSEQKQECLYFIENYLTYDTKKELFNAIDPESCEFYEKLITFSYYLDESGIETTTLMSLIKHSIKEVLNQFNTIIKEIDNNTFTKKQLIRMINTINDKISQNSFYLTKLDEYLTEISHIINSSNFQQFTQLEQSQLQNTFNDLQEKCKELPFYHKWLSKLKKDFDHALFAKTSLVDENPQQPTKSFYNRMSYIEAIKNTVENESSPHFYNKLVLKFINAIESEFAYLFQQIDVSELRELNWTRYEQRVNNDLDPLAPNVKLYHHYFDIAVQYMCFLCFYHIDNNQAPKMHHDLNQVKQYYQFIENALTQSLQMNALTTAYIIFKAIQSKSIKRLHLESKPAQELYMSYLSKSKESQTKIARIMREDEVLPLLPFIEQKLIFSYKKNYGSQFERLSSNGRILKYFESKKNTIQSNAQANEELISDMENFLQKLNVLSADEVLDTTKSHQFLIKASYDLSPDLTKKFALSDFKTLTDLVKHLKLCQARLIDHQFKSANPENEILKWLMSLIKTDNQFSYFSDALETIFILNEINQIQKRSYKRFHAHLVQILTFYLQKVTQALKNIDDQNHHNLDYFFAQFNKMKRIRDIKDMDESSFDIFSSLHAAKNLLKKFDEQYTSYVSILEQFEKSRSQTAYSQLLEDVLSGNAKKSLTLPTETVTKIQSGSETLLPENEYDIPSAEPEHPDRIGINRTMSFTQNDQSSVLSLFKTDDLKIEFISAFPWAIQIDSLEKLKKMTFDPKANLLGTPRTFNLDLQLAAMRLVLISLDSLGKIAGFSGQLTIQNFDLISEIVNQLKWLTLQLKDPAINESLLLEQIKAVTQELAFHNQEYFEMQQLYNPPFVVEDNPNMNGFCHLNEHLVFELTGNEYQDTVLAPAIPAKPYSEKISQVHINHEKT